jgi:prepilin-type N-terminal cleavage/methylation domain-containing protein
MCYNKSMKKNLGFTLIELLVVIAIIAILAVVVVLTLNPAQLLAQSRDSNRVSDMATLKNAIGLYATDQSGATGFSLGTAHVCDNSLTLATTTIWTPNASGTWGSTTTCLAWFASATSLATTSGRSVNGTGWLPVDLASTTSGAPIGTLPVDPLNTNGTGNTKASGAFFYSYITDTNTFKLGAFMESTKYSTNGSNDIESNVYDGGLNNYVYEQGSNLAL